MKMTQNIPKNEKLTKNEFKIKLIELIQLIGVDNLNISQLEREYGYTRKTISRYLNQLLDSIPESELSRERVKAYYAFIGMNKEIGRMKLKYRDDIEVMPKLIETERKVYESAVKVWEAFGLKDKVAEKLEVSSTVSKLNEIYERTIRKDDSE